MYLYHNKCKYGYLYHIEHVHVTEPCHDLVIAFLFIVAKTTVQENSCVTLKVIMASCNWANNLICGYKCSFLPCFHELFCV